MRKVYVTICIYQGVLGGLEVYGNREMAVTTDSSDKRLMTSLPKVLGEHRLIW